MTLVHNGTAIKMVHIGSIAAPRKVVRCLKDTEHNTHIQSKRMNREINGWDGDVLGVSNQSAQGAAEFWYATLLHGSM